MTAASTRLASDQALEPDEVFGFWIFLMTDAVIFALVLVTYAAMTGGTAGGPGPTDLFVLGPVLWETLALLTSSLAFGLATEALGRSRRAVLGWLAAAAGLAVVFLWLEGSELARLAAEGATPDRSGFLSALWTLLALHGLHVAAGLAWLGLLAFQLLAWGETAIVRSRLIRLGLFWHFLDVVWIAIFSVVYLGALA